MTRLEYVGDYTERHVTAISTSSFVMYLANGNTVWKIGEGKLGIISRSRFVELIHPNRLYSRA